MDVTKSNLRNACKMMTDVIKQSSFIAIDGEFTGLHNFVTPNAFDTPEERYQKLRQGSMEFLLIQFGVCIFKYDGKNKKYVTYPFNFYVFPRPMLRGAPDQRFLCQSSSMDFLASHGFDFNKVFREGIPYLTPADKEKMKEAILERHAKFEQGCPAPPEASPAFISPAVKKPMEIPNDQKSFINSVLKRVEEFMNDTEKTSLQLEKSTGYQRKLAYQVIRSKYPSGIYMDTQHGKDNKADRYIFIRKVGEEDKDQLTKNRLKAELDELEEAAGFGRVIQILSESGKVIVGHNMMLDVMHTLHQFSCPLPESLDEFKALATCVFPKLADTKVMANTQPFKDMIPSTALNDLCSHLKGNPFPKPVFETAPNFPNYNSSRVEQYHQAGYDAYVTGQCFATMANYLGTFLTPPKPRVSPTSNLIEPFLNKLCLFRVQDIPYVNLAGPDLQPGRAHVFHVTFPNEWSFSDIFQLFNEFGHVYIGWIDDTSAFVSLNQKDRAQSVLKRLKPSPVYKVITYKEYRQTQCQDHYTPSTDPLPSIDKVAEIMDSNITDDMEESPSSGMRGVKRLHDSLDDSTDAEVAEVMGSSGSSSSGKKHKAMDPNAKPFVSRITPPPSQSNKDTPDNKDAVSPKETKTAPKKLFAEPANW